MNGKLKQAKFVSFAVLVCLVFSGVSAASARTVSAAAKKAVSASVSSGKVKVGKTARIASKTRDVAYASSDRAVASVSEDGTVTGKKPGKVVVTVSKSGFQSKKLNITVSENKELAEFKALPVSVDEIAISGEKLAKKGNGYAFSATVTNRSELTVKKLVNTYEITNRKEVKKAETDVSGEEAAVETTGPAVTAEPEPTDTPAPEEPVYQEVAKKVKLTVSAQLKPGASKKISCEGAASGKTEDMRLLKTTMNVGEFQVTYSYETGSYSMKWLTKDKEAPVISFAFDRTVYIGVPFEYDRYLKVSDNRDLEPKLTVNRKAVNEKKAGSYKVTFTAEDSSGNQSSKTVTFRVMAKPSGYVSPDKVDSMADAVLKKIVRDSMSKEQKARAIYAYIRNNFSYVNHSSKDDWVRGAYEGLALKRGDCFVYYATAQELLTRAGIPNMKVERKKAYAGSSAHYWSLVDFGQGWYHFDTTPRTTDGSFCLLTDSQLTRYSSTIGRRSHVWDYPKYPKSATKEVTKVSW